MTKTKIEQNSNSIGVWFLEYDYGKYFRMSTNDKDVEDVMKPSC